MNHMNSAAMSSASSESQWPPPPPVPHMCVFCGNDLCSRVGQMPALYGIRKERPTGWQEDDTVAVCGICIGEGWRHHTKLELEPHSNSKMAPWELDAAWRTSREVYEKFFPALQAKVLKEAAAKAKFFGVQGEITECWYIKRLQPDACCCS